MKDKLLETILPYIKDKDILDIGCVEHDIDRKNKERIWVHDFLRENAKHVTGIDILKKDIKILKKQGYDVYCQSAESFKFNKKFDVIFAGELIEHLSNPGLFLQQCKMHLKKEGRLIITTPNAFSMYRILVSLFRFSNDPPVNDEHTAWFSPKVMKSLLTRNRFITSKIKFVDYPYFKPRFDIRIVNYLTILISRLKETMIIIAN